MKNYMIVVLLVLLGCGIIAYCVWVGPDTGEAGLKKHADNLTNEDAAVRERSRERLISGGIRSITPLLRAIKLGDLNLRIAAIDVLRQIGVVEQDRLVDANIEKAVQTLGETIARAGVDGEFVIVSTSHPMRLSVARTLGQYPSEEGVELLLTLLRDKEEDVRLAARDSLISAGGRGSRIIARELAKKKSSPENALLEGAVDVLVNENMVRDMLDKDAYEDLRMRAARSLKDLGGARIEDAAGMCSLMLDEDEPMRLRKTAAELLPEIPGKRLGPLAEELRRGLEDKNGAIALGAAKALAAIGDPMGMDYVINCLKNDSTLVRLSAAEALQELAAKSKKEVLANLDNSDALVRGPVLRVLPSVTSKKDAAGKLDGRLSDSDGDVRMVAEIGLGEMRDKQALRRLISCLDDKRERVRHYAAWAIKQIGSPSRPLLDATLNSLTPYPFDDLAGVMADIVIEAFHRRGIATRRDAVEEAVRSELQYRRMNLPTPVAVKVEAKAKDGKQLTPILLDVRELFVFLATLSRMTGVPEKQLLAMGRHIVEDLNAHGIRFKRYDELEPRSKSAPEDVVALRDSSLYSIADLLGVIGDKESAPPLLKALMSDDLNLQASAAWATGMIADRCKGDLPEKDKVIERLVDLMQNSEPDTNATTGVKNAHMLVREKSAEALGKIGLAQTKADLQTALVCDDQVRVRTAASIAIGKIDGTDRRVLFDQYADALKHADPKTRAAAAKKIAELGSFEARDLLLSIIHAREEYGEVLDAAEAGLKELTGRDYSNETTARRLEAPSQEQE